MEQQFWQEKWEANETGFHQDTTHPLLEKYYPKLDLEKGTRVYVPLCGKSIDMIYLMRQGCKVIGLELSEVAVQSFFIENDIEVSIASAGEYKHFQSSDIQIWCGDFFSMPGEIMGGFSTVYDRASLIALPPEMRLQYVDKMKQLSSRGIEILLIALEYEHGLVNPPPFTVVQDEVENLYGSWCDIELLEKAPATVKGKPCYELVYRLRVL